MSARTLTASAASAASVGAEKGHRWGIGIVQLIAQWRPLTLLLYYGILCSNVGARKQEEGLKSHKMFGRKDSAAIQIPDESDEAP